MFRVPPGSPGIEAQLGIVHGVEESAECLAIRTVGPGNDPPLKFGNVVSVDRKIMARLSGDEPRDFLRYLAFGYTSRQALTSEAVVDQGLLFPQLSFLAAWSMPHSTANFELSHTRSQCPVDNHPSKHPTRMGVPEAYSCIALPLSLFLLPAWQIE
jgi:hypothetical protein